MQLSMPLLDGVNRSSRARDVPDCGIPPTNTNACSPSSVSGCGGGTACRGGASRNEYFDSGELPAWPARWRLCRWFTAARRALVGVLSALNTI